MIKVIYGITIACNLCDMPGPLVRYDQNRYRIVPIGQVNPNAYYISQINNSAEKQALKEGFVALGKDEEEVDFADNLVGAPRVKRHICPKCLEDLKQSTIIYKLTK